MEVKDPLEIGTLIQLRPLFGDPNAGSYRTRVEGITDNAIVVQRPTKGYEAVHLPRNTRVEITFTLTEPPGRAGRYRAETDVIGLVKQRIPLLRLQRPKQWERSQVREFFRVEATLPCKVRPRGAGGDAWREGTTKDVSGGGCQVVLPQPLARNDKIEIEIDLPTGLIVAFGTIRRVSDTANEAGLWTAGIRFDEIDDRYREALIQFAFQRQIELRRRGMA